MQFLPKRMLTWLVPDAMVVALARALISVNKSDNYGDGKVFVCSVEEVIATTEESILPEEVAVEVWRASSGAYLRHRASTLFLIWLKVMTALPDAA